MDIKNKLFRHVALIGRPGKDIGDTLEAVKNYLLQKKISITIEKNTAEMITENNLPVFFESEISDEIDLIIVVGGDGSLLNAVHIALSHNLPILGINRGRLGFLTDISPDELEKIGDVLTGNYITEFRSLITANLIHENNTTRHLGIALNEIALLPGNLAQLIEFDITINNQFVCKQRADGLIIATPTGSTAYALSGGGPILQPQLNAMVLVPMFPHTLSARPIVVDGKSNIELSISENTQNLPHLSCDGQNRIAINTSDKILISPYEKSLQLIHPTHYNYFATLREKLGWQSDLC